MASVAVARRLVRLIAGNRGRDPGAVEGRGAAARERRARAVGGRVDLDRRAGLGEPLTSGLLSLAGESGSVSLRLGVAGAVESCGVGAGRSSSPRRCWRRRSRWREGWWSGFAEPGW